MSISEVFGSMVFNDSVMQQRLPHDTYRALRQILREGGSLDRSIADIVANAMKDWALEKGATSLPKHIKLRIPSRHPPESDCEL